MVCEEVNLFLAKLTFCLGFEENSYRYWNKQEESSGIVCWRDRKYNRIERGTSVKPSLLTRALETELCELFSKLECDLEQGVTPFASEDILEGSINTLVADITQHIDEQVYTAIGVSIADITKLSIMTYEGSLAKGRIAFLCGIEDEVLHRLPDVQFELTEPIFFHPDHFRAIRKFLEGCEGRILVFSSPSPDKYFQLLGYVDKKTLKKISQWFFVEIIGARKWLFGRGKGREIYVDFLNVKEPHDYVKESVNILVERLGVDKSKYAKFLDTLIKQKHGTSVIFYKGDGIDNRLNDLYMNNRAVKVDMSLDKANSAHADLLAMSRIDGAFAVNVQTEKVRYFGTILDGKTVTSGRIERGARYNALNNFVNEFGKDEKNKTVAVVISEDSTIDILHTEDEL